MQPETGCLLRIFIGEGDKHNGHPLYEWIVSQARGQGLAGATVLRGLMGFGSHTRAIHTFKIQRLSEDLPMVVELVDAEDKLETFLAFIEQHVQTGMLTTMEKVQIRLHRGVREESS